MPHYTRGMGSRAYWEERMLDRDLFARQTEDEVLRIINSKYQAAFREIRRDLNDFYNRYATENGLTLQQLQQRLSPIEMREYQAQMRELQRMYSQYQSERILQEMQILSNRAYITRQMALLDSINIKLIETAHNVQITMQDHLEGIYRREYAAALEGLGVNSNVVIPTRAVREIIEYPYAGAMFSDRIWRNKDQLLNYINDDLVKGIIKGSSIQNMSKDLMNRCNTLYYQAERLVRTETNYAMTQGHLNGYKDAGIEQYQFFAFIDNRTSRQCKTLDNMVYDIREAQAGTNLPPMHPNCRSTIIPIIKRATPVLTETPAAEPVTTANSNLTFKNTKEAAAYLKDNYGFEKVSFGTKTSLDMITSLVNNTKKVYDRYPELKGFVRKFESGAMKNTYAYFRYGYDKNGNVLTLKTSSTLMDTIEKAKHHYDRDVSKGFHPKGTTYNDIIVHELGHVIDAYLTAKQKGINNIKHNMSKEDMIKLYHGYSSSAASTDIINQAFNNLGITEMKDKAETIKNLSRYALQSRKETLAEAFADAMANGDKAQPLSKEILKIIDKEMKE